MSSPYEDDVLRILEEKRQKLQILEGKALNELGFFGRRRLAREIHNVKNEIAYLEDDVQRYRNGVSWNRKTVGQGSETVKEH